MKKFLLLITTAVFTINVNAQNILAQYDFTGYNGLASSVAPGWTVTNNDSTTGATLTLYNTSGFCGGSCPAYKFNITGAAVISPTFANATQVRFYMKGNGTIKPNPFTVYSTTNGTTWNPVQVYNPVPSAAATYYVPLTAADIQVKFEYVKDSSGYNVGLDDIVIADGPLSTSNVASNDVVSINPTISKGTIYINSSSIALNNVVVSVSNLLGKELKRSTFKSVSSLTPVNLSDLPDGIYIVKLKSSSAELTRRIILSR